jgi:hypothetical protein
VLVTNLENDLCMQGNVSLLMIPTPIMVCFSNLNLPLWLASNSIKLRHCHFDSS